MLYNALAMLEDDLQVYVMMPLDLVSLDGVLQQEMHSA